MMRVDRAILLGLSWMNTRYGCMMGDYWDRK